MISIFNGRRRSLGGSTSEIYAQVSVDFRDYLHLFKGARLGIFMAIALHADENGWAYPSYRKLAAETGYSEDTIRDTLAALCDMEVLGHRVLLRYQPQAKGGTFASNRYLVFPSSEEVAQYEGTGVRHLGAASGGRLPAGSDRRGKTPRRRDRRGENPQRRKPATEKPHDKEEPSSKEKPAGEEEPDPPAGKVTVVTKDGTLEQRTLPPTASPASILLECFGIGAPTDTRVLGRDPDPDVVRAWMLYALTQPGLDSLDRYVAKRLLDGDTPAPRFIRWGRLTPDEWRALWRADHYGGPYRDALPADLQETLDVWARDFDGVFADGPFGTELIDEGRVCTILAELGDPPAAFDAVVRGDRILLTPETDGAARWLQTQKDIITGVLAREGVFHEVEIGVPDEEGARYTGTDVDEETDGIWRAALGELQLQMTQATFDTWLRDSRLLRREDGTFVIGVKSEYAKDWLEHRLCGIVRRTLTRLASGDCDVRFVALSGS